MNQADLITAALHLCLVWPQWQGAGTGSVCSLAAEFPFDIARRGYSVGTKVLQVVLPEHAGRPLWCLSRCDIGLKERDGIEAKAVVLQQLRSALAIISEHEPARITLEVGLGEVWSFGVSHRFGAFDRWPAISLVDHSCQMTGAITTDS